jgi:predicted nucleic acid-binding Zn ribbon protein
MRDEPGAACPACGGASARLFFPAGIVFKGSGFYKTDSRGASSSSITSDGGDSGSSRKSSDKSSDKTSIATKSDAGTSSASTSTASSDKSSASTDAAR